MYFAPFLINSIPADVIPDLSSSPVAQDSHPYNTAGDAEVLYIFSLACFWTWEGFEFLLIIPVIWRDFDIVAIISFSF